ncbi:hypothetical protein [Pseudomonas sp. KCJK9016]|uniref:hypothetical protein n=1 Tax=Pseudomonas sp. KCJK9016 TaxID=3344556 RepID=UPI003906212E
MATPTLRILIADEQHSQCNRLEKILNRLGYFRMTPVLSFTDLQTLTHYTCEPFELFDVLLINMNLFRAAGVNVERFCRSNPQVTNTLVYGIAPGQKTGVLSASGEPGQIHLVQTADEQTVRRFMAQIDPGELSALSWFASCGASRAQAKRRGGAGN